MPVANWPVLNAVSFHMEKERSSASDVQQCPRSVTRLSQLDRAYAALCAMEDVHRDAPSRKMEERFTMVMAVFIGLSILVLAAEIEMRPPDEKEGQIGIWLAIESVFIIIFFFEILFRMSMERARWIRNLWSWFDVAMVVQSVTTTWVLPLAGASDKKLNLLGLLRVARLARIIRLAKLIASSRQLYIAMMAWWSALQGILYMYAMLVVGIFLYAMVGTQLIGHNEELQKISLESGTAKDAFGSIASSMYTLFQLMTLQGFEGTTRPLVMENPALLLYFGSFVLLFTFGLLNMLIGLTVERTLHEASRLEQENRRETPKDVASTIATLRTVFQDCDTAHTGTIPRAQFLKTFRENKVVREALNSLGLPTEDVNTIYNVADWDGDGSVGYEEFIVGVSNLRQMSSDFAAFAAQAGVRAMQRSLDNLIDNQEFLKEQVSRLAGGHAVSASGPAAPACKRQNAHSFRAEFQAESLDLKSTFLPDQVGNDLVSGTADVCTIALLQDQSCGSTDARRHAHGPAETCLRATGMPEPPYKDLLDDSMTALRGHIAQSSALAESQSRLLKQLELLLQQLRQPFSEKLWDCPSRPLVVAEMISVPSDGAAAFSVNECPRYGSRTHIRSGVPDHCQHDAGTKTFRHVASQSRVRL